MSYWDTSALVKLYAKEPDSFRFENFARNSSSPTFISRIAIFESLATFRRKESEGTLIVGAASKLYAELVRNISAGEIQVIDLGADVESEFASVLEVCYRQNPRIPLRTLDVLHLASARVSGQSEVVVTDKRLRDAAGLLGFSLFPK